MASPVDTFKSSLFGQLKSYSNAVQGAFEQRIARPLLAFKRDLSRPTSESRAPHDLESSLKTQHTHQESTSSSSPLEIIDIDTTGSFRSIFDKVKNTLSPTTKRRTSENPTNDSTKEARNSSISSLTKKNSDKNRLHHNKSVSFADNVDDEHDNDSINQYSIDDRNEIVRNAQTLANQIVIDSIDEATTKSKSSNQIFNHINNDDEEFQRDFRQIIKPRQITHEIKEDLVYQDLSAEIVAYVLKHALRTLKKEDEQKLKLNINKEESDDFIDLK